MKQPTCHPDRTHKAKGLCGPCSSATWHAANKEKVAIWRRAYNLANRLRDPSGYREKRAVAGRAWRVAHPDYYRGRYAANPERQSAIVSLRRARKLGAIGAITSDQWASIKAAYVWRCAYCGKKPATLTQDHVIPLSLGGSHTPANIVPACRSCNSRKGNRPPTRLPAKRLFI